jgi:signal transduction histidine kinase
MKRIFTHLLESLTRDNINFQLIISDFFVKNTFAQFFYKRKELKWKIIEIIGFNRNEISLGDLRWLGVVFFLIIFFNAYAQQKFTPHLKDSLMTVWNNEKDQPIARLQAIQMLVRLGYLNSNPDSALLLSRLATNFADQENLVEFMSWARKAQGISSANLARYEDALMFYYQALKIDSLDGNVVGIGNCYNNIANVYNAKGDFSKSLLMHENALKMRKEIADTNGIRSSLVNLGVSLSGIGNFESARQYYEEALNYLDDEKHIADKAVILTNLGDVYRLIGRYNDAIVSFNESIDLFELVEHKAGLASSYKGLSLVFKEMGSIDKSIDLAKMAMKIEESLGNKHAIVGSYLNIGSIELERGNYSTAINYQMNALKLSDEIGHKNGISGALGNLARIYSDLGDFEKALEYNTKSLVIDREIGDKIGEAVTLSNMGIVYAKLKMIKESKAHHTESLSIRKQIGDRSGEAASLSNLGNIYMLNGQLSEAEEAYTEALLISEEINNIIGASQALIKLGNLNLEQNRSDLAFQYGKRGYNLAIRGKNLSAMRDGAELLWKLHKLVGQHSESLRMLELHILYRDSIVKTENQREIMAHEFQYNYEKKSLADSLLRVAENESLILNHQIVVAQKETERNLYASAGILLFFMSFIFFQRKINRNKLLLKEKEAIYQKEVLYATINSQEIERKRIARDLHDEVGAMLATIKLNLGSVNIQLRQNGFEDDIVAPARNLVDNTIDNVRSISKNLLPPTIEEFGLAHALSDLAEKVQRASGIKIEMDIDLSVPRLEVERELAIYRIIQEMLNNALKHSSATIFTIELKGVGNTLILNFSDNGVGFDMNVIKSSKTGKIGLGLKNIESRAGAAGAHSKLYSAVGKGTKLELQIPVFPLNELDAA